MNQIEKIIDIATWNRREHYEHFSAFDDPFFGVTVNVDCTRAYQEAKDKVRGEKRCVSKFGRSENI